MEQSYHVNTPQVVALLGGQLPVAAGGVGQGAQARIDDQGREQPQHRGACHAEPYWHLHTKSLRSVGAHR